jgi:hypothetical protein
VEALSDAGSIPAASTTNSFHINGVLVLFSALALGLAASMLFLILRTEKQDEVQKKGGVDKH